jgi:predicted component of type VI protein secretion system
MYMLRLFGEDDAVHPLDARLLRDGVLRIGRDPSADWSIPDPDCEISRAHCELDVQPSGLVLRVLGANGAYDDASGARLPDGVDVPLDLPRTLRLGRFRLVAANAPHHAMLAGAEGRTMVLTPPLGDSTNVPSDWSDAKAPVRVFEEGSLLEAFCQGAGLDASLLSAEDPAEIMRRAGAVYRQMVLGIGDLMTERDRARAQYHLTRTTIGGASNNPFKWAPTQRLAIDLLLQGASGFLSGPAALKASFQDIKRHLVATFAGLQASLRVAVDSFEPATIDAAIAGRSSLLRGRASLQWQEACDRQADLLRQLEKAEDGSLNHAFVAAYDAADSAIARGEGSL